MTVYRDQEVLNLCKQPPLWLTPKPVTDLEFHNCELHHCNLTSYAGPKRRQILRNVRVFNCWIVADMSNAVIEDILVDGLKTGRELRIQRSVFKHVILRGKIGDIGAYGPHLF